MGLNAPANKLFEKQIARLKKIANSKKFIHYGDSRSVAKKLRDILKEIVATAEDPRTCFDLIVEFIKTDNKIYSHCDDSSGCIGNVYADACQLFAEYASKLPDESYVVENFMALAPNGNYGTRDNLTGYVNDFLSPETILKLINKYLPEAKANTGQKYGNKALNMAEYLAREAPDTELYEKILLLDEPENEDYFKYRVAKHYLTNGDLDNALARLTAIKDPRGYAHEVNEMLLCIHQKTGNRDKNFEIAKKMFMADLAMSDFEEMVKVKGEESRDALLAEMTAEVLASDHRCYGKALFLVMSKQFDKAETFILRHAVKFDGMFYYSTILAIIDELDENYPVSVSILYRALIEGNLKPARAKIYHHGVKYLRILDKLAENISDWKGMPDHAQYKRQFKKTHARKSSFWSKYGNGHGNTWRKIDIR